MPCVTNQSQNLLRLGPLLDVVITPSTAYLRTLKDANAEAQRRTHPARLLIDTGASKSAIYQRIAKALGLRSHGVTTIATPSSTSHTVETFDMDLLLPTHQTHFQNRFVIASDFHAQGIDELLGRDISAHWQTSNGKEARHDLAPHRACPDLRSQCLNVA